MTISQHNTLQPGDPAPNLELTDQDGNAVSLNQLAGQDVVVYFYPKAFTPGCTNEACDFRDNLAALRAGGVTVLGISADPVDRLAEFQREYDLNFTLLSDPESATARAWGAWGLRTINGEQSEGPLRSTVVVGADQRVRSAEYGVTVDGHVASLREFLLAS